VMLPSHLNTLGALSTEDPLLELVQLVRSEYSVISVSTTQTEQRPTGTSCRFGRATAEIRTRFGLLVDRLYSWVVRISAWTIQVGLLRMGTLLRFGVVQAARIRSGLSQLLVLLPLLLLPRRSAVAPFHRETTLPFA